MEENNSKEKPKYKLDYFGVISIAVMVLSVLIGLYFLFVY